MKYYFVAYEKDLCFTDKEGKKVNYAKIVLVKENDNSSSLEVIKATRNLEAPAIYTEVFPLYDEKGRVASL